MLGLSKSDQLFQILKDRIENMSDGDRFPSVREIMKEYNVSQFTVTPAMSRLEEKNLIRREVGKGTFVRKDGEQKPFTLYYYLSDWPDDVSRQLEHCVMQEANTRNYDYRRIVFDYRQDIFKDLPFGEADAIFINPAVSDMTAGQLDILRRAPIPVILKGTFPNLGLNYVAGDNNNAGMQAANYFINQGHRNIAILLSEPFRITSSEVFHSYTSYAESRKVNIRIIDCETNYGELSSMKAYETLSKWLGHNSLDFSAIFVVSDESALGALKAFEESNISVPDDVCVLGYGGSPAAALFNPSLSSVSVSRKGLADSYFELLDQCLATGEMHGHTKIVHPELIERTSTMSNVNIT
jgi:DNA-binding LacI/PurR family transcriptional regulator